MKKQWLDWLKAFVIAMVLAIIVRVFLFAPVVVDGPSMMPNLHNSDHIIVSKIQYKIGSPERFDIVVFHATEQKDYIKRIVGLPGEQVVYKNDHLYIDGESINEPFLKAKRSQLPDEQVLTHPFSIEELPGSYERVPQGHVLVLGDHRQNSTDSRMLGMIPMEQIVGEAVLTYWPYNRIQLVN